MGHILVSKSYSHPVERWTILVKSILLLMTIWFALAHQVGAQSLAQQIKSTPLMPADLSSPRATINSFMASSELTIELWKNEQLSSVMGQQALFLAAQTMDLSTISSRSRSVTAFERIVLLREILQRVTLPDESAIPDVNMMRSAGLISWNIPDTPITILLLDKSDGTPEYVFSMETIRQLPHYYQLVADKPSRDGMVSDLLHEFQASPGPLLSREWIASLPVVFHIMVAGLASWQWGALLLVSMLLIVLIRLSFKLGNWWDNVKQPIGRWHHLGKPLSLLIVLGLFQLSSYFIVHGIWLFGPIYEYISIIIWTAVFYYTAWFIMSAVQYIGFIISYDSEQQKVVNASLITVLSRIIGGSFVVLLFVYAAEFMGISIAPLLAGLGVGGIAIALAIRPLLENLISGLTLYADKGVKIGELCKFGAENGIGVVENIGLRSTRIRTLERSVVTIPNTEFAQLHIDNLERRDKRRLKRILKLNPTTSMEQLQYLLVQIRRIFLRHPQVDKEIIWVRFSGYCDHGINIEMLTYILCKDTGEYLATQEDIFFHISKEIEEAGTTICFVNQHQYAGKSPQRDQQKTQQAEDKVSEWKDEKRHPFPDFDDEYKLGVENTMPYPSDYSMLKRDNNSQLINAK